MKLFPIVISFFIISGLCSVVAAEDCPTGTKPSTDGKCVIPPGYYLDHGSFVVNTAVLKECEPGYRCVGSSDLSTLLDGRQPCVGGYFQSRFASDGCLRSPAGFYATSSDGVGNDASHPCEAGYGCSGDGRRVACTKANEYAGSGSSGCSTCEEHYYVIVDEEDMHVECSHCKDGHSCSGGKATPCPRNTYAFLYDGYCTACPRHSRSGGGASYCVPVLSSGAIIAMIVVGSALALGAGIFTVVFFINKKKRAQANYTPLMTE